MRVRKFKCLLMIMAVMALAVGCTSDDYIKTSYKSLKSAGVVYDTSMKVAAEAYKSGIINEGEKNEIIVLGQRFYSSYMVATAALETAENATADNATVKEGLVKAMKDMWLNYDTYKMRYNAMIKAYQVPEVTK